jgi:DNA-binding NtrC family response regulator
MPELIFYRRGEELLRVTLERQRLVLGRGEGCDVIIPDPHVSRQHVALLYDGDRCALEDLSGQGTVVVGKPMKHGELPDGADLELGQWRAIFRLSGSSGAEDATSNRGRTDVKPPEALKDGAQPARLRVKQGTTELVHEIGADSFTLGKAPDNALVVTDRFISNKHLRVTRTETGFHVKDLNSTNGTYLDGVRLYEAEVPLHTVLRAGEAELYFEPLPRDPQAPDFHGLVGNEPALRQLVELVQRVAPSDIAVTIHGESGTGKELVAKALHECSPRAGQRFLAINCAAVSPAVTESELFGHEKGAFTGADSKRQGAFVEADGGTLFLDEVGELPLELQAKLLRVLENGEVKPVGADRVRHVDVRVVAATHRDLLAWARQGKFREDLYYRLNVMPLTVPPLRGRKGDLQRLAEHFLRCYEPRGQAVKFTPAAVTRLQEHSWPGNVRELRNVVHRALLLRKGPRINAQDLIFDEGDHRAPVEPPGLVLELPEGVTLEEMMERVERQLVESTLRRCHYKKERTAKALGISRTALFNRLKAWGINPEEE